MIIMTQKTQRQPRELVVMLQGEINGEVRDTSD